MVSEGRPTPSPDAFILSFFSGPCFQVKAYFKIAGPFGSAVFLMVSVAHNLHKWTPQVWSRVQNGTCRSRSPPPTRASVALSQGQPSIGCLDQVPACPTPLPLQKERERGGSNFFTGLFLGRRLERTSKKVKQTCFDCDVLVSLNSTFCSARRRSPPPPFL